MAPKGNAKKQKLREADKKSKESAAKEAAEAEEWQKGAKKDKGQDKAAKAAAAKEAKAARDAALAEEEASIASKPKPAPKAGNSKSSAAKKPAAAVSTTLAPKIADSPRNGSVPGTPRRGAGDIPDFDAGVNDAPESFSARGIDDALDMLSLVTEKTDKASVGQRAAQIDSHPERRYKAALAAYKERELPQLRKEHPGLRLNQYEELIYKNFKKSPENPFNQVTVAFDASKEEKVEALRKVREETEKRLRDDQ